MIKLHNVESVFQVQQYYDALQAQGIPCLIYNQFAAGAAGELPIQDVQPELWLLNHCDLPLAEKVISTMPSAVGEDTWTCRYCREVQEPAFNLCWQCQQPKDE